MGVINFSECYRTSIIKVSLRMEKIMQVAINYSKATCIFRDKRKKRLLFFKEPLF